MEITPITGSDTRRQTGNQAWPLNADGNIGRRIARLALDLKGLLQRDMASRTVTDANRLCDDIIAEAERVEGLETVAAFGGELGGAHG
jgi:hypothetical protein